MKASLTSTWISSDSMSTTVPMPVRVKPPPPEIGEMISPGCAALTVITPAKGARTTVLSTPMSDRASDSTATWALLRALCSCAASASRSAWAWSSAAAAISWRAARSRLRARVLSASVSCACARTTSLRAAASWAADRSRWASASVGSSRASTSPSATFWPSSM